MIENVKGKVLAITSAIGVSLSLIPVAFGQEVAASSTQTKLLLGSMFSEVMAYFQEILPFWLKYILGVALLFLVWRFIMGFTHRR